MNSSTIPPPSNKRANFIESGIIVGTFCGHIPDGYATCSSSDLVGPYKRPRYFWGDGRCCGEGYQAHVDVNSSDYPPNAPDVLNTYHNDNIRYEGGDEWYMESGPWSGYSTSNPLYVDLLETGTEDTTQNEAYACNGQSGLEWIGTGYGIHSDWPGAGISADNPPYAKFVGTADVHDWAGLSESSCYGSASPTTTTLSNSQIESIALAYAASFGDSNPTSIQYVESARNQAVLLASAGDVVQDTRDAYLIVVQGSFVDDSALVPAGASAPTGSVFTLVVDAQTGQLTDLGVQDNVPELSSLGRVTVDR